MSINAFLVLFIFIIISGGVLVLLVYLEDIISPKVKSVGMAKAPVESAEKPLPGARLVGFQYYLYAILFVIIEALLVFLLLWAQDSSKIGIYVFTAIGVSLLYMLLLVRYFTNNAQDLIQ
ncbi:MAG: NADH-quinone oxidoreductase subunit A [Candidatus Parvarchaeota archaeon]|nr:NADH-quinone oxidoreductase subunit A [Candidatus Parvarchaeota archaeon]MCL5101624.1 NADH-quinone oxidoreductase subunit A [Candidatus Parvarchaeota archaeon]